jgi:hypothetical protein
MASVLAATAIIAIAAAAVNTPAAIATAVSIAIPSAAGIRRYRGQKEADPQPGRPIHSGPCRD